jgi:ubiquinone/menaquinone biosynthesis C-methylase UbiE
MNESAQEQKSVWDSMWRKKETTFDSDVKSQWLLFDKVKFEFLSGLFIKSKGKQVLECGCGGAIISVQLSKRGYETTMLDFSNEALRVAQNNFSKEGVKGNFILGNVENIPLENNTFDIVMSHGLLEHFRDINPPISEKVRVLRPGGIFFADLVPKRFSVDTLGNIFSFFYKFIYHIFTLNFQKAWRDYKALKPDYYENSFTIQDYKIAMENAGLVNVKIVGNRPFPALSLPPTLDGAYAKILKNFMWFWKRFDQSAPAAYIGAGWWAWGYKKTD